MYKIKNINDLESALNQSYDSFKDKKLQFDSYANLVYEMIFYWNKKVERDTIRWEWVLNEFKINNLNTQIESRPRAVILIKIRNMDENNNLTDYSKEGFAVSYGHAYHLVDAYANMNWVLEFADKLEYKQVKKMTVNKPSSRNNKRTNTYTNYDNFDFSRGDILKKFDAYIDAEKLKIFKELPNFELSFNGIVEIGNSLKVNIKENNLESIVKLIDFINYVVCHENDKQEFPTSNIIEDKEKILELDNKLWKN